MDVTVAPLPWPAGSIPTITIHGGPSHARVILRVGLTTLWTGITDDAGAASVPPLRLLGALPAGAYRLTVRAPAEWPQRPAAAVLRVAVVDAAAPVGSTREGDTTWDV